MLNYTVVPALSLSLGMGYPLPGTVTHSLAYGFRNLLSIAVATDIDFKEADEIKAILSDPEAMAKLLAKAPVAEKKEEVVAEVAPEPDDGSESDSSGGLGGLFD